MAEKKDIKVRGTFAGELYVEEKEFLSSAKFKEMLQKLLNSAVQKAITARKAAEDPRK